MKPVKLVTDSNVWIDLNNAGLLHALFELPHTFIVPDVICAELKDPPCSRLEEMGLKSVSLPGASVRQVPDLRRKYPRVGLNDLFALVLARDVNTPLITGDRRLREACVAENVPVYGVLWLLDLMLYLGILTVQQRTDGVSKILACGGRLPRDECARRMKCREIR